MKKSAGRAMRRKLAAANRKTDSDKKQAMNERKLLHFSNCNGPFKKQPKFLSNLKGAKNES
jgi:hypothetical protein